MSDSKKPIPTRIENGFSFGAAKVVALASDERGYAFIKIKTDRDGISVHVTPSGMLRVWRKGYLVFKS